MSLLTQNNNIGESMQHECIQKERIDKDEAHLDKLNDQSRSYDIALTKLTLTIEDFSERIDRHSAKIDGVAISIDQKFDKINKELELYRKVITGDTQSPGIAIVVQSHEKWLQNSWKYMVVCAIVGGFVGAQVPDFFKILTNIIRLHVGL